MNTGSNNNVRGTYDEFFRSENEMAAAGSTDDDEVDPHDIVLERLGLAGMLEFLVKSRAYDSPDLAGSVSRSECQRVLGLALRTKDPKSLAQLLSGASASVLTGAVRAFYKTQTEPIVPLQHYPSIMGVASASTSADVYLLAESLALVVDEFSVPKRTELRAVCDFLRRVKAIPLDALAATWAPFVLRAEGESVDHIRNRWVAERVVKTLLVRFDVVFRLQGMATPVGLAQPKQLAADEPAAAPSTPALAGERKSVSAMGTGLLVKAMSGETNLAVVQATLRGSPTSAAAQSQQTTTGVNGKPAPMMRQFTGGALESSPASASAPPGGDDDAPSDAQAVRKDSVGTVALGAQSGFRWRWRWRWRWWGRREPSRGRDARVGGDGVERWGCWRRRRCSREWRGFVRGKQPRLGQGISRVAADAQDGGGVGAVANARGHGRCVGDAAPPAALVRSEPPRAAPRRRHHGAVAARHAASLHGNARSRRGCSRCGCSSNVEPDARRPRGLPLDGLGRVRVRVSPSLTPPQQLRKPFIARVGRWRFQSHQGVRSVRFRVRSPPFSPPFRMRSSTKAHAQLFVLVMGCQDSSSPRSLCALGDSSDFTAFDSEGVAERRGWAAACPRAPPRRRRRATTAAWSGCRGASSLPPRKSLPRRGEVTMAR